MFLIGGTSFAIGLLFISGSGLYWLDIVDYFMNNFGLILACMIECVVFAWVYKASKVKEYTNSLPGLKIGKFWTVMIKYISPVVLLFMLVTEVISRVKSVYGDYPREAELVGWAVMFLLIPLAALIITKKKGVKTPELVE